MNANQLTNTIAAAAKEAVVNAAVVSDPAAELEALKAENAKLKALKELEALKAENAKLLAAKAKPAITAAPKPAAAVTAQPAADKPPIVALPPAAIDMLLQVITMFKSKPRADGRASGALAVKIHGFLHDGGMTEDRVRSLIASAVSANVISKMSVPTKTGKNMMLYFDAKERPNYAKDPIATEKAKAMVAAMNF